jgi:monoamine oxidase
VKALHKDVPVQLNCPVSRIDYSGPDVRLTTPLGTVSAKQVVLTVSTGVLAADSIRFVPSLPNSKIDAIDMLPNGLLNKVGIEFDLSWTKAVQGQMVEYLSSDTEYCSVLFGFFGTPLATGFVAGRFADTLEADGPGAATDYCLEGLRAVFGTDVVKSIHRTSETAWRGNATTDGSYSYAKPGGTPARETLAAPLADRLFFAGEATMKHTYSTVHGAYLSGKVAAAQVMEARGMKRHK